MRSKICLLWCGVLIESVMPTAGYANTTVQTVANALLSPKIGRVSLTPVSTNLMGNVEIKDSSDRIQLASDQILVQVPSAPAPDIPQTDPNSDRFPQSPPTPSPLPPDTQQPVQPSPDPTPEPAPTTDTIQVNKIEVTGSTVFGSNQLDPIIKPVEGRTVTLAQLRAVADQITQLYLDRGDITTRAILVDQNITDGVVQIRVIEGKIERIDVEGTRHVNPDYVRSRVALGAKPPLNTGKLEDQLRLLRADPLFENVEASLRSGSAPGQSIVVVRVTEANRFQANVGVDNSSPPSVGGERFGTSLLYRNLTGLGDQIAASYNRTWTGGADTFDFSYRVPVNAMNGTLELRYAPNRNHITLPPFDTFDIKGNSDLYEISYRQPLKRSPREEFALSLGLTHQDGQTFLGATPTPFTIGTESNGVSRTSVIKFGQDYVRRSVNGAWGMRSLFSLGTGLLDATLNPEPIPDSRFFSWLGQVQRVQILSEDNFLIVQGDLQLTPNSLLPSEQFVIGGAQSVRGFRQNARGGDNGLRFSVEDRITIQRDEAGSPTMFLAPFFDLGWVWNKSDNPNVLQDQTFLAGAGLGLLWKPLPRLNLRIDYGLPLVNLRDRGTNAQDEGFYFNVNYQL